MPKRIPTPEPGDDEPKYFTVVQPYPLNANWELPHDYISFGRWIAGCIGPEPFFALFYKPSARGQVLLEINRDYAHPERLLGEHRWSEFLKKPSVEEAGRVSQIFYCVYSTGRQAQKDGWKRINVADSWFKDWSPANPTIQNPYPPTLWCPLPAEDRTNKPMCRPLPVSVKPPPPQKAAPAHVVPGSATWVTSKGAPTQHTPAALRGAWSAANTTRTTAKPKGAPPKSSAPWHTATAPKSSNTVPLASAMAASAMGAPALPPGLGALPPGLFDAASTASSSSSAGSLPAVSATQYDSLSAGFVSISLSPSQEAHLYGAGGTETSPDPNAYVAEWERMPAPEFDVDFWPGAQAKAEEEAVVESLWGEEDEAVEAARRKRADAILCTVHGIICKKGICKEYARMFREKERAEKEKERAEKGAGGGGGGGGGGWNKAGKGANGGNNGNNNGRRKSNGGGGGEKGWDSTGNGYANGNEDDSSSATGSEGMGNGNGRAKAGSKAGGRDDVWATVRR